MKRIHIFRWASTPYGVFSQGSLGLFECAFVEPCNKKEGKPRCIPAGLYIAELDVYYGGDGPGGRKDYLAYELRNVPGFSEVKMHIGNYYSNSAACPLPGQYIDWNTEKKMPLVTFSEATFNSLMKVTGGDKQIEVEITWADTRLAEVYF